MSKYRIFTTTPACRDFLSVLDGGGGVSIDCSFCERTHYAVDSNDFEEGEYDRYEELRAKNPEGYIPVHGSSVHYRILDGMCYPDECPCNGITKYERFMWNHRQIWANYLMMKKLSLQKDLDSIPSVGQV